MNEDEVASYSDSADIDSVAIVMSSLAPVSFRGSMSIPVKNLRSIPEKNKKITSVIEDKLELTGKQYWYQFRVFGTGVQSIFCLYNITEASASIISIRKDFFVNILKVAASALPINCRSRAHSLASFTYDDRRCTVAVHEEDWPNLVREIDRILSTNEFYIKHKIGHMFFYSK